MKNKLIVAVAALTLVLSGGGILVASANQGFWDNVAQRLANGLLGKVSVPNLEQEQVLGAVASADNMPSKICQGQFCSVVLQQTFIDASTTIVSIQDPFTMVTTSANDVLIGDGTVTGATSTVDLVRLDITGVATTSLTVDCGASTGPTVSASTNALLSSGQVPTSSPGILENNLTGALGGVANGGTVPKIVVGHMLPYFTCTVTESVAGGVTNPLNTFAGKALIRFSRMR